MPEILYDLKVGSIGVADAVTKAELRTQISDLLDELRDPVGGLTIEIEVHDADPFQMEGLEPGAHR